MCHEVIVFADNILADKLFHERKTKCPGKGKRNPRTDAQADCGIDGSQGDAIKISSYETGHLSGNGSNQDLKNLKRYEDNNRQGTKRINKLNDFLSINKKSIEVEMNDKKSGCRNEYKEDDQSGNVFVHKTITV